MTKWISSIFCLGSSLTSAQDLTYIYSRAAPSFFQESARRRIDYTLLVMGSLPSQRSYDNRNEKSFRFCASKIRHFEDPNGLREFWIGMHAFGTPNQTLIGLCRSRGERVGLLWRLSSGQNRLDFVDSKDVPGTQSESSLNIGRLNSNHRDWAEKMYSEFGDALRSWIPSFDGELLLVFP